MNKAAQGILNDLHHPFDFAAFLLLMHRNLNTLRFPRVTREPPQTIIYPKQQ